MIDLAARLTLSPGKTGATSAGSYAPYAIAIRATGATLTRAPMRNFSYDLAALADIITPETRIVYVANPNNPTGTAFGADEFSAFLARVPSNILIVLDEAYIHYADRHDMPQSVDLFRQRDNLLVMRTFSKVYGLAAMRIGYAIVNAAVVAAMNKLRTPFNAAGVSQAAHSPPSMTPTTSLVPSPPTPPSARSDRRAQQTRPPSGSEPYKFRLYRRRPTRYRSLLRAPA